MNLYTKKAKARWLEENNESIKFYYSYISATE